MNENAGKYIKPTIFVLIGCLLLLSLRYIINYILSAVTIVILLHVTMLVLATLTDYVTPLYMPTCVNYDYGYVCLGLGLGSGLGLGIGLGYVYN